MVMPVHDTGIGDTTEDTQAIPPILERSSVTRSGRITNHPERLVCDRMWCQKATVLLALTTKSNERIIQNVLQGWLAGH